MSHDADIEIVKEKREDGRHQRITEQVGYEGPLDKKGPRKARNGACCDNAHGGNEFRIGKETIHEGKCGQGIYEATYDGISCVDGYDGIGLGNEGDKGCKTVPRGGVKSIALGGVS